VPTSLAAQVQPRQPGRHEAVTVVENARRTRTTLSAALAGVLRDAAPFLALKATCMRLIFPADADFVETFRAGATTTTDARLWVLSALWWRETRIGLGDTAAAWLVSRP